MFYILISFISGIIIVFSRVLNTKLTEKTSLSTSTYFNYFTAFITCLILFFMSREKIVFTNLQSLPFYAYLGGVLGVIIVALNSIVTPKISSFYVTLLIFITQLFTGFIIDSIMAEGIPLNKVFGGTIVVLGLAYNLYADYKDAVKE